jgi:flagellar biosynthesis regulator FlaF
MNQIASPRAQAAAVYRQTRTPKQAEAAVFAEANRRLRAAEVPLDRLRAVADTRRLWVMVLDLVSEPANQLPAALRGQIASVAHAVLRECDAGGADVEFLLEVNEQVAAGLWS